MAEKTFIRWLAGHLLTTEQFKNVVTMCLVLTYCALVIQGEEPNNEFALLVGMVLGFYFKKE